MDHPREPAASYEDLSQVPEHLVAEIIDWRLITHPRPALRHAHAASALAAKLVGPFDKGDGGPGGWWVLGEPELHLDSDILVPDLAGWLRERMPHLPDTAWFEFPPDWICEVLSPATARLDRAVKMALYAAAKVRHLWLADPDLCTLETYQNLDGRWLLLQTYAAEEPVSAPPFDAIQFDLGVLWAD